MIIITYQDLVQIKMLADRSSGLIKLACIAKLKERQSQVQLYTGFAVERKQQTEKHYIILLHDNNFEHEHILTEFLITK